MRGQLEEVERTKHRKDNANCSCMMITFAHNIVGIYIYTYDCQCICVFICLKYAFMGIISTTPAIQVTRAYSRTHTAYVNLQTKRFQ